ncbi:MAG: SPOR domain-containing protein [Crocinitomicaceae bacterium]|nr:SPOR domain-containing protein [Crocinitomicaceae bacterium]
MMKSIILGLTLLICSLVIAQDGDINVIKDNRIDALVDKQGEIIPPAIKPEIDGYRIQLFFDSSRDEMNSARSKFIARFPKTDTYVEYNAPNFFLKAGDFRTRLEAEKVKAVIEAAFPTSFIVKEKINLPRLEKDND